MKKNIKEKINKEARERISILRKMGLETAEESLNNEILFSKPVNIFGHVSGINFSFKEDKELNAIKEEFEKDYDSKVYYGMFMETAFGRLLTLLYVDEFEENWEQERNDLKRGSLYACCYNLDEDYCESGKIGFKVANGGLIRTR